MCNILKYVFSNLRLVNSICSSDPNLFNNICIKSKNVWQTSVDFLTERVSDMFQPQTSAGANIVLDGLYMMLL